MDYDKLREVLPKEPTKWTVQDTEIWLNYIGLTSVSQAFKQSSIDGSIIQSLTEADLRDELAIKSNITVKKLMSWIKVGIKEYQEYLAKDMKTTCFKGDSTIQIQDKPAKSTKQVNLYPHAPFETKESDKKETIENKNDKIQLVIKQEESEDPTVHSIGIEGAKIGRHTSNQINIVDEGVSRYHAEIVCQGKFFFLKDIGSTTGTFIKLNGKTKLEPGMLLEMGSYTFFIEEIDGSKITLEVIEGPEAPIRIQVEIEKKITIGRKSSNKISFPQDHHMSNIHACIFTIEDNLYIQDLGATNGTWRRLSSESSSSEYYPLANGDYFKVSTSCTYSCRVANSQKPDRIQSPNCMKCLTSEKDCVLMPCKHNCVCMGCSQAMNECPYCKCKIDDRLKIYG